jgi:DNA-binding GntR family transcriptional regulator
MRKSEGRISHKVLKEIFPKKLTRGLASERIYTELKQMILSGKLKKGERLFREKIAADFNVTETVVAGPFSRLKKDGLITVKGGTGSFVA